MAGLGSGQGTNYFANLIGAPQILQGTPNYNVEVSEGQNPPGEWYPAHYLPALISENRLQGSYFVLMPGKVVALDTNKRLIPAYLGYEARSASGTWVTKYTALDEEAATRVPGSNPIKATAGTTVASLMSAAGISATVPVGIMRYSALAAPGTDPSNPATFFRHAYDTGGARAFSRWCYIQVPVVEVNERVEVMSTGATDHRIALWPSSVALRFFDTKALGTEKTLTLYAAPNLMTPVSGGDPTQYCMIGRTIFFNGAIPAGWTVRYTPDIKTPFSCLKVDYGTGKIIGSSVATSGVYAYGTDTSGVIDDKFENYLGQLVTYDVNSNFQFWNTATASGFEKVGRILDVKAGTSQDLALVRTYFRDQGLWQEAPGSATDGRGAQLSIANAPRYIARIAVNFNGLNF